MEVERELYTRQLPLTSCQEDRLGLLYGPVLMAIFFSVLAAYEYQLALVLLHQLFDVLMRYWADPRVREDGLKR